MKVVLSQKPGVIELSNFSEIKSILVQKLSIYENALYVEDTVESALKDRDDLKALKKYLDETKKEIKSAYCKPYEEFEAKIDELIDMIKVPLNKADTFIKDRNAKVKQEEIMAYAKNQVDTMAFGNIGAKIINSKEFLNPKWLNASYKTKQWREDVDAILLCAQRDLNIIASMGDNQSALLSMYLETLSMDKTKSFYRNMKILSSPIPTTLSTENQLRGYKVLKVYGAENQLLQLMDQIDLMGVECELLEDGMPQGMLEITEPNFLSFVAFDIEHTGTYGIDNGDEESEIIEIGAVKVVNGVVVDKFDRLANPGRKIIPRVERLTHITNEMVAIEPIVSDVIKDFKNFIGDMVLVGHNLKSCDIPHISRAARKAGIIIDNEFFDTKILAKNLQNQMGWEEIKLPYLSKIFGISQSEAHRAWCDAEANAYVYLELKKLYKEGDL